MTSTPFGPLPPPAQPEPEQPATHPDAPQPETVPAPETGADAPPEWRSITPAPPARDAEDPEDPGVILDPVPWEPEAEATLDDASPGLLSRFTTPGDSTLPSMLMAAGVLVAIIVLMRLLTRRHKSRPAVPDHDNRIESIHERAAGAIGPVERTMAQAEEVTRRLAATMENKAARLELLIEEADRKLEELNRAVAQASRGAPAAPDRPRPRTIDPALLDLARVEQDMAERNGRHETEHDRPRSQPEPGPTEQPSQPADPVHRRVWALADDGVPPLDIARSLNQPVGQVELILNLRRSG